MRYNIGMNKLTIAVIGGGASGMLCAQQLSLYGNFTVTIFERGNRLGRKLSATGNGQGNVTNRNFGVSHYFSDDKKKVEQVLSAFNADDLLSYFNGLGGLFESDEQGRVYPSGRQASSVTDLLRFALDRQGVTVKYDTFITKIAIKEGKYILTDGEGYKYLADVVVLCAGGKAAKNFGTDGAGYDLCKMLGHTCTPLYPALVQLKTDTKYIRGLKGIRVECGVTALDGDRVLSSTRGDVIFTDYGVSGNAIFSLSSYLMGVKNPVVALDFLPDYGVTDLAVFIQNKEKSTGKENLLGCILNNRLGQMLLKRVEGESGYSATNTAKRIKNYTLSVVGSLGFDYAQVTKGGVPMPEVNEHLESVKSPKLYLAGEVLNVDGECGGYNLQWAFSSGMRVAKDIIEKYAK